MKPVIDIHSHILPYVDDGSRSADESKAMLSMYESQNTEALICTPHFGPCAVQGVNVQGVFDWFSSTSSSVKLYFGNEINYTDSTLSDVRQGRAKTLAGSNYILVEFETWSFQSDALMIYSNMKRLTASEYIPVLAHAERYESLQYQEHFYEKLTKSGVKLQINAYDIYETQNRGIKRTTQMLLKNKLVSFIGSDAHGISRRAPALQTGVRWVYDHCPQDYADAIVHDNAAKIIGGA